MLLILGEFGGWLGAERCRSLGCRRLRVLPGHTCTGAAAGEVWDVLKSRMRSVKNAQRRRPRALLLQRTGPVTPSRGAVTTVSRVLQQNSSGGDVTPVFKMPSLYLVHTHALNASVSLWCLCATGEDGLGWAGLGEQPVRRPARPSQCRRSQRSPPRVTPTRGLGWEGGGRGRDLMVRGSVTVVTGPMASAAMGKGGKYIQCVALPVL